MSEREEERRFHMKKEDLEKLANGEAVYRRIKQLKLYDPEYLIKILPPPKKYWTA